MTLILKTWLRYGQDVTPYQKRSFYVNSFKSYLTDTHTHRHDENITSTAYAGGKNEKLSSSQTWLNIVHIIPNILMILYELKH